MSTKSAPLPPFIPVVPTPPPAGEAGIAGVQVPSARCITLASQVQLQGTRIADFVVSVNGRRVSRETVRVLQRSATPLARGQHEPKLRAASVDGFRAGMGFAAGLAFLSALIGAVGLSDKEARGTRPVPGTERVPS